METLQNFIYPMNAAFGSAEKYLRTEGSVHYNDTEMFLQKYSNVQFDTYYNAFSIPLWQKRVGLTTASLQIAGSGKVEVELWEVVQSRLDVSSYGYPKKLLAKKSIELSSAIQSVFDINITDELEFTGLVYPKIIALEDVKVTSLTWSTADEKRRSVKVGISVTHFNRKEYVIPAIKRIKENLLDVEEWADKIDFIVVDNSQNITPEESMGVKIVPNENTGGSGGFTRGFLHYKYNTEATHVLFMDDDASLEVESIKRAYQILSFAVEDNTAVGAALFYDENPNFLIERGAYLSKRWVSADFHNAETITPWDVLKTELSENTDTTYMGWWFCAFPIKYTKRLVPPYFVRGDDASFTQINDFNIIYANGIAAYAESFLTKVAGMTTYLDTLNPFIVNALFNNHKSLIFAEYIKRYLEQIISGRYGYVDVMRLALKNFGKLDAERFVESINLKPMFPVFKELTKDNTLKEIDLAELPVISHEVDYESRLKKFGRLITFNKLFLPLNNTKIVQQEFIHRAHFRDIAGFRKIVYYDIKSNKGFVTEVSRWKTLKYLLLLAGDGIKFIFTYPATRRRLLKNFDYLTSEQMWDDILKLDYQAEKK